MIDIRYTCLSIAVALVALLGTDAHADEGFRPLLDGTTLKGWQQRGGKARYHVEDGQIVGSAARNTPNSFLCTKKNYSNFILELDFKVDPELNSGVQIRSQVYDVDKEVTFGENEVKRIPAGRVHGYQVEIDPSSRAWTAGIYDEGRRGWLNTLEKNEPARQAFRQNEWNHFRIVCDGDSIKTWLNDVPAADLNDSMTGDGFIALQVHGIGRNPEHAGRQVRWRNIMIKELK